jgi:divalent metal cation (Fe/Co/Zn/Cd) transporter
MSRVQRLTVVLVMNVALVAGLVLVGLMAHSLAGGWYWLDPAVALVIAVVVGYHAQKLVRKVRAAIWP